MSVESPRCKTLVFKKKLHKLLFMKATKTWSSSTSKGHPSEKKVRASVSCRIQMPAWHNSAFIVLLSIQLPSSRVVLWANSKTISSFTWARCVDLRMLGSRLPPQRALKWYRQDLNRKYLRSTSIWSWTRASAKIQYASKTMASRSGSAVIVTCSRKSLSKDTWTP